MDKARAEQRDEQSGSPPTLAQAISELVRWCNARGRFCSMIGSGQPAVRRDGLLMAAQTILAAEVGGETIPERLMAAARIVWERHDSPELSKPAEAAGMRGDEPAPCIDCGKPRTGGWYCTECSDKYPHCPNCGVRYANLKGHTVTGWKRSGLCKGCNEAAMDALNPPA